MRNKLFFILMVFLAFSCGKDDEKPELEPGQKEATGTVWISGGLFNCHSQIRTDEGKTLIPMINGRNSYPYKSGLKVYVMYEELEINPGCSGIACTIIKTELIE
jgi:hypothetical protein